MDLPVLLLKFRDYLLWLGPIYLLAVALDGATTACVRRWLHLPQRVVHKTATLRRANARLGAASALDSDSVILQVAWHVAGRPSGAWRVSTRLYIWAGLVSRSGCWTALLLTSLLSWHLSVMRLGTGILMVSLLALLAPFLIDPGKSTGGVGSTGVAGVMIVPVPPEGGESVPRPGILREWWRSAQARLEATGDSLLLGVGLGAAFIAISPGLTSLLKASQVTPVSQIAGTAIGLLAPLLPGTELPLLVAMQSRGVEGGAPLSLFLVVTVSSWLLARDLYYQLGLSVAARYMAVAGLLSLLLALLAGPLFGLLGAL